MILGRFPLLVSQRKSPLKNILITVSFEMIEAELKFDSLRKKHNRYFMKHLQLFTGKLRPGKNYLLQT